MRSRRPGELRESLLGQHLSLCVAAHLARTQLVADPLEGAQAREGANLLILKEDGVRGRKAAPPAAGARAVRRTAASPISPCNLMSAVQESGDERVVPLLAELRAALAQAERSKEG